MSIKEQYHLEFYKMTVPNAEPHYYIGNENAPHKSLALIYSFPYDALIYLVDTIGKIQAGQPYDLDFYLTFEEFIMADLGFTSPYIYFNDVQTIHMDDFKLLILEWLDFLKT
jgi:hypothetical protein